MNRPNGLKLLAALLSGGLLSLGSTAAEARDEGRWRHEGRGWERQYHKHPGHRPPPARERTRSYAPERHYDRPPRVIHHHHYGYGAPYSGYGYSYGGRYREPSVVITLPPVVIPLR